VVYGDYVIISTDGDLEFEDAPSVVEFVMEVIESVEPDDLPVRIKVMDLVEFENVFVSKYGKGQYQVDSQNFDSEFCKTFFNRMVEPKDNDL